MKTSFEIFISVIIPTLKITEAEKLQLEQDPTEFIFASDNLITERDPDQVKTHAPELLLAIGQNIDGMLTFMVDFCLQMLEKKTQNQSIENQTYINNVITKYNLKLNNDIDLIEINLMILSILSELIKQRLDLQILIDRQMINLIPIFLNFENNGIQMQQTYKIDS